MTELNRLVLRVPAGNLVMCIHKENYEGKVLVLQLSEKELGYSTFDIEEVLGYIESEKWIPLFNLADVLSEVAF